VEDKDKQIHDEIEIDLTKVAALCKQNKSKYAALIAGCMLVTAAASCVMPDKYESNALVRVKVVSAIDPSDEKKANKDEMSGYLEIMQSRNVIEPLIDITKSLGPESSIRANKDIGAYVKKYLQFTNLRGTDLIRVTAAANNPEEAQMIAQNVLKNVRETLTNVNKMGRSTYLDFLNERLNIAEKEMKEAETALEDFKKQSKVFAPDSQLESLVAQLNDVDKNITDIKVNLDIRNKQIELLDDGVAVSAYNSGDATTNSVRSALLSKQLVLQEQLKQYTEKHPLVQKTKKEVAELQNKVRLEAKTEIAGGEVQLNFLNGKKQELEQRISRMSEDKIKFVDLERKVSTTRETYMQLIKSMETSRTQEAINSMDLWVIDNAHLPLHKSNKPPLFFAAIGAVIGALFSLGHAVWKSVKSK